MTRNFRIARIAVLSAALALPAVSGAFAQSSTFNNAEAWPQEKVVLQAARSAPSALPLVAKPLGQHRLAAQGELAALLSENSATQSIDREIYNPGGAAVYP